MYQLAIGNKNYSSWSLRPWLLMQVAGLKFEEINIELYSDEGKKQLQELSGAAKVPVLIANEQIIWDSLAICEYLAEQHPEKALWPLASDTRAIARSVVSEMHAGFSEIRNRFPMNCRLSTTYQDVTPTLENEIARICQIWRECRDEFGQQGNFLFGNFSIADAFYAPIALRFNSYGIALGEVEQSYIQTLLTLPELQKWITSGCKETTIHSPYELE